MPARSVKRCWKRPLAMVFKGVLLYSDGINADLAQLVEHLICNQGVTGSSPVIGTISRF
jgi:hypothetical protein